MPKTSDKTLSVLIRNQDKSINAELFPASLWPDRTLAEEGLYRLRIGKAWWTGAGKYTFLSLPDAFELLRRLACGEFVEEERPALSKGARVRVVWGDCTGPCITATPPFRGVDGRWRVFVSGREEPALVEELEW